jgi:hypothetical protein
LRTALKDFVPEWIRLRPKVVLSEGLGLRGNDPEHGLFRQMATNAIPISRVEELRRAFPEWGLQSAEEAYYFAIFAELGYTKASFASERVTANRVHSVA